MNVQNKYKGWEVDLIRDDVQKNTFDYACCMWNMNYDFNIGTMIRNANAFGVRNVYYLSDRKKWDRRAAVGVQNYTNINYLKTVEELEVLKTAYTFVGVENNIERHSVPLQSFSWPSRPLILFGCENMSLPDELLDLCDTLVEIPLYGSVRSLNVGSCSAIVFNDYINKR